MPNMIRVQAVEGRLYPHPSGHRPGTLRFIGRTQGSATSEAIDERFPMNDGEEVEFTSDISIALAHGDLVRANAPREKPADAAPTTEPSPAAAANEPAPIAVHEES